MDWGEGNIDDDPEFVDPDDDDFHLEDGSPCINTGNPDSPEDPDGTRADMGAYPYFTQNATLQGFVLMVEDDSPIADALIVTENDQQATTDEEGFWQIENAWTGEYWVNASKIGFNDLMIEDVHVQVDDTVEVTFRLTHPQFLIDPDVLSADVPQNSTTELDLMISNDGSGPLDWSVDPQIGGGAEDPWTWRRSLPVGLLTEDDFISGVSFADEHFYVSGKNGDDPPLIYVFNMDGDMVGSFEQLGVSALGMRDLTYDGELIWGSGERDVFGFTTDGDSITSFSGPFYPNNAIGWDSERELLWISGTVTDSICGYDREGNYIQKVDRHNLNVFGLACFPDDPDGYTLYVFNSPGEDRQIVSKINPETDEIMDVVQLEPEGGGRPQGAFITNEYDLFNWIFMSVSNAGENDRVDIWQLAKSGGWLDVDPRQGSVIAGESTGLSVFLSATRLPLDTYEGELYFRHNAADTSFHLPITMTVIYNDVSDSESLIPSEIYLNQVYPNPFNSVTTISFGLPSPSEMSLCVYDLTGRLVHEIEQGSFSAGHHVAIWDAGQLPSGVYLLRMETGEFVGVKKVTLIR